MLTHTICAFIVICSSTALLYAETDPGVIERYLLDGKLQQGLNELRPILANNPQDDTARFGIGVLRFLNGVEQLGQALHKHGLRVEHARQIPFLRIPVPMNPDPTPLTYAESRKILENFQAALKESDELLAGIQNKNVKMPLRLMDAGLDIDSDGSITVYEVAANEPGGQDVTKKTPERLGSIASFLIRDFPSETRIDFDYSDALWLRGYCHLMLGLSDIVLAYDGEELFETSAHLLFKNPKTKFPFLQQRQNEKQGWLDFEEIADVIATIHMIRLPVKDPTRMKSALEHWETTFKLSRQMVASLHAETDSEKEWIPNAKQTGWQGAMITSDQLSGWLDFVSEMENVLAGKALLPFWRGQTVQGVNLRRVFLEPTKLDVVLWVQGTAAAPYLEQGRLIDKALLNRLERTFRGDFLGFALWMN